MCKAQNCRRAAHVLFHQPHGGGGLQIQPARVKTHAFAHQRKFRPGTSPTHVYQSRRAGGCAPNRVDHREILHDQIVAHNHITGCAMGVRQVPRSGFQLRWPHVRGGCIDEIAGQRLSSRDGFNSASVDCAGSDQPGHIGRARFVAVEMVSGEQPAEAFGFQLRLRHVAGDTIRAQRQAFGRSRQQEPPAPSVAIIAKPSERQTCGTVPRRDQNSLALGGGKPTGFNPGAGGRICAGQPGIQILSRNHVQINGVFSRIGEGQVQYGRS